MGLLCDYFAAGSDDQAAAVIDHVGGPGATSGSAGADSQPPRRGYFRRRHEPSTGGPLLADAVYATVPGNGIEPVVQMGTLKALLTGRSYDEVMAPHPGGQTIAVRDGGERLVMKLTGTLSSALAAASDDRLAQVAVPWSQTDEFWGQGEPEALAGFLRGLAGLARQYLYCWVCV